MVLLSGVFFFKQKTAYEMRIIDWSSDVCSSDLLDGARLHRLDGRLGQHRGVDIPLLGQPGLDHHLRAVAMWHHMFVRLDLLDQLQRFHRGDDRLAGGEALHAAIRLGHGVVQMRMLVENVDHLEVMRSEEHTSELQSLMRISSAVFCLKKKTKIK